MNKYRIVMRNGNVFTATSKLNLEMFVSMVLSEDLITVDDRLMLGSRAVWLKHAEISSIEEDR